MVNHFSFFHSGFGFCPSDACHNDSALSTFFLKDSTAVSHISQWGAMFLKDEVNHRHRWFFQGNIGEVFFSEADQFWGIDCSSMEMGIERDTGHSCETVDQTAIFPEGVTEVETIFRAVMFDSL